MQRFFYIRLCCLRCRFTTICFYRAVFACGERSVRQRRVNPVRNQNHKYKFQTKMVSLRDSLFLAPVLLAATACSRQLVSSACVACGNGVKKFLSGACNLCSPKKGLLSAWGGFCSAHTDVIFLISIYQGAFRTRLFY